METQNYKRTVAGSVGAGMGAIFNGSGRTYYILEHRNTSKYHRAGEAQKIIIDQIELGRDSSCQVRFDESFETVSRKHCAIVRDGQNWQLIHLSQSNPTLVNGRPVQGQYYLQSGDEIQLAVGGPRLGFIVPQGKQALTSSIRLTERMNLFREQALRPYRRALWVLTILLLLVIVGFGTWNLDLQEENKKQDIKIEEFNNLIEYLDNEIANLDKQIDEYEKPKPINTVIYSRDGKDNSKLIDSLKSLRRELEDKKVKAIKTRDSIESTREDPVPPVPIDDGASDNIRDYYDRIYRIIVDNITIEDNDGISHTFNNTSQIDCGSGFISPNGTFFTARQNIQPWIYVDGKEPAGSWRRQLAAVCALGYKVIITYSAYSTKGPFNRITFNSDVLEMPTGGDIQTTRIEITEEDIIYFETIGLTLDRKRLLKEGVDINYATSSARAWAALSTDHEGIPTDAGASNSIAGGQSLDIVYYTGRDVRNLEGSAQYSSPKTQMTDNRGGTIRLQSGPGEEAFGAPVFIKGSDDKYRVVGMYVGNNRVVPIHSLKK